jgi:hypothetical protein
MMEAAAAPVPVHVSVADAMIMMTWDSQGLPGQWDVPVYPAHWRTVVAMIREGDVIAVVAEMDGQPVITIPAVVVALNASVPCIEVIA